MDTEVHELYESTHYQGEIDLQFTETNPSLRDPAKLKEMTKGYYNGLQNALQNETSDIYKSFSCKFGGDYYSLDEKIILFLINHYMNLPMFSLFLDQTFKSFCSI